MVVPSGPNRVPIVSRQPRPRTVPHPFTGTPTQGAPRAVLGPPATAGTRLASVSTHRAPRVRTRGPSGLLDTLSVSGAP